MFWKPPNSEPQDSGEIITFWNQEGPEDTPMFWKRQRTGEITQYKFPTVAYKCYGCGAEVRLEGRIFAVNSHTPNGLRFLCDRCRPKALDTYLPGCEPFSDLMFATRFGWIDVRDDELKSAKVFEEVLSLLPETSEEIFRGLPLFEPEGSEASAVRMDRVVSGQKRIEEVPGIAWGRLFMRRHDLAKEAHRFWRRRNLSLPKGFEWGERQVRFDRYPVLQINQLVEGLGVYATLHVARLGPEPYYAWVKSNYRV